MKDATETRLALPWPPSVNNLYISAGHKRVRSPGYRKWQDEAGWRLKAAKPGKFIGAVNVEIELCPPDRRRFDVDNKNKAILDLLVTHGVIEGDDSRFVKSAVVRCVESSVHSCIVTVRAA